MMNNSVKIDWFSFSFPRENGDVVRDFVGSVFHNEDMGGSRWHKKVWKCWEADKYSYFLLKTYPRVSNGKCEIEFPGAWFQSCEREKQCLELFKYADGKCNRLDVAFDLKQENAGESWFYTDLQSVGPKQGKNVRSFFDAYEEWTGTCIGYGKGSEVALRIYDKAKEQKAKAEMEIGDGMWWWRVEISLRGDTLKGQDSWWFQTLEGIYDLGRAFLASRYQGWPSWFEEPKTLGIKPRPKGIAGIEGKVLYWQRKLGVANRRLEDLAEQIQPGGQYRGKLFQDSGSDEGFSE